jgi:hypothetical protein
VHEPPTSKDLASTCILPMILIGCIPAAAYPSLSS